MNSSGRWSGPGLWTLHLAVASALSVTAAYPFAQVSTPTNSPAASAAQVPPPLRPVPRLTNSSDAQRSMDLNNEQAGGKVVPQLRVPLGKNAGPPVFERRRGATATAASAAGGSIDDSAARCESEADKTARSACLSRTKR